MGDQMQPQINDNGEEMQKINKKLDKLLAIMRT